MSKNKLPVMETFYSLQGEGIFSGSPAYFIRLAGCDVGCVWCDVKDSWDITGYPQLEVTGLAQQVAASGARIVVITGGEPLMYDLAELTAALHRSDLRVHLETSGAYPLSGEWDWICVSPKKFKPPLPAVMQQADELKIIVANKHDLQWAAERAKEVAQGCTLLLQPEWSKAAAMLPEIISFAKQNPAWRLSLQTHKYLNIP